MNKKQKQMLYRILLTILLFVVVTMLPLKEAYRAGMFLFVYVFIGWNVLFKSVRNILKGQIFDENFLMSLATIGAITLGEYHEGVEVMLFYQIGELFQSYAVERSRRSISQMMDICPEYANVEKDGNLVEVDPDEVEIGDIIVIKPGEKIPLDGIVIEGNSLLDTAALTGESVPRSVKKEEEVLSGFVNLNSMLKVKVSKVYEDSTVARVLELVENSAARKAKTEKFITKFAKYYTPAVVIGAVLLSIFPPLFFQEPFTKWMGRALTFLVISCPCALVISVPLGFFGGIGGASKAGILMKGGNYIEALSKVRTVVFDKTGTLTKGSFQVVAVHPKSFNEETILEFAALSEGYSNHPIAISIRKAYGKELDYERLKMAEEVAGQGIISKIEEKTIYIGNEKMMDTFHIDYSSCHLQGTTVHIAIDGIYAGHLIISDEIKEGAKEMVSELGKIGIRETVMLTGDMENIAANVAEKLGVSKVHSELLPDGKVNCMEELLSKRREKETVVFVGDGINDAPVLSIADIGIAMGALGSDAAIEAADIVLMDDKLSKIPLAIKISKRTMSIVKQNIFFALGIKSMVLLMGAMGFANMQMAVFADVGVAILAILNSFRSLRTQHL